MPRFKRPKPVAPGERYAFVYRDGGIKVALTTDEVARALKRMKTRTGGGTRRAEFYENQNEWSLEPAYRQRLDHYGNEGEGWDQEGWDEDYSEPLRKEAQAWLDKQFGRGFFEVTDVGEKGHLYVGTTSKGEKQLKQAFDKYDAKELVKALEQAFEDFSMWESYGDWQKAKGEILREWKRSGGKSQRNALDKRNVPELLSALEGVLKKHNLSGAVKALGRLKRGIIREWEDIGVAEFRLNKRERKTKPHFRHGPDSRWQLEDRVARRWMEQS